jgi:hypothetical protein
MKNKDNKVIQLYDKEHKLCNIGNPFAILQSEENKKNFEDMMDSILNTTPQEKYDWCVRASNFRDDLIENFKKKTKK